MDEGPDAHAIDDIFSTFNQNSAPKPLYDSSDPFAELFVTPPPPVIPSLNLYP